MSIPEHSESPQPLGLAVDGGVGRPAPERTGTGTLLQAAVGALLQRHARAQGLVPPIGCGECAWGKVLGCWRCGGR